MKQNIIFFLIFIYASGICSYGQSTMDQVFVDIEVNNPTLQVLKQQAEMQKLANRTGIYLSNPEVEFAYLWGTPSSTGKRTDFSVSQTFDFPTTYIHKSKVADGQNRIADFEYEIRRRELLLEAGTVCVNLIYCNALKIELDKRQQHAQSIANSWQERFARGDADILERNKAQLNLLNARKASEANEIERNGLLSELQRLNNGQAITFDDSSYPIYAIPQDFDQWYAQRQDHNPVLQTVAQEIEVSKQQEKLSRSMSLPKFSAGYMSEAVLGTTLRGPFIGFSIPLWENKNTLKHAKTQTVTWQKIEADTHLQFYSTLKMQYAKALGLQTLVMDYRAILEMSNNFDLLKKSLDQGQLSLINYMIELSVYYDAMDQVLQAERDSWLAMLELRQWEE